MKNITLCDLQKDTETVSEVIGYLQEELRAYDDEKLAQYIIALTETKDHLTRLQQVLIDLSHK